MPFFSLITALMCDCTILVFFDSWVWFRFRAFKISDSRWLWCSKFVTFTTFRHSVEKKLSKRLDYYIHSRYICTCKIQKYDLQDIFEKKSGTRCFRRYSYQEIKGNMCWSMRQGAHLCKKHGLSGIESWKTWLYISNTPLRFRCSGQAFKNIRSIFWLGAVSRWSISTCMKHHLVYWGTAAER